MCLLPDEYGDTNLLQASCALHDLESALKRLWLNVPDQATASAGYGKHDRQPTSGCLHPFYSPLDGPLDSE